ncbi:MAG: hypothetical protein DMG94_00620 [Acidobacteria bacterium]|nr:MAG: hypothetical protein DMG94_00620 [Acidobacteriota bacterium]
MPPRLLDWNHSTIANVAFCSENFHCSSHPLPLTLRRAHAAFARNQLLTHGSQCIHAEFVPQSYAAVLIERTEFGNELAMEMSQEQ